MKGRADSLQRKLQRTSKDQYTITIPKAIVQLLKLKEKEALTFSLEGDSIVLRRK